MPNARGYGLKGKKTAYEYPTLTRSDIARVIDGRSNACRVPVLFNIWLYPEAFREKEQEARDIIARYPDDISTDPAAYSGCIRRPGGRPAVPVERYGQTGRIWRAAHYTIWHARGSPQRSAPAYERLCPPWRPLYAGLWQRYNARCPMRRLRACAPCMTRRFPREPKLLKSGSRPPLVGRHVSPGTLRCWPRKLSNPPVNETRRMQGLTGVRIDGIIIFKLKNL